MNGAGEAPCILTVGALRDVLRGLPSDTRVGIDMDFELDEAMGYVEFDLYPIRAWVQASDVVEPPVGTDPMEEGTVSVLLIELAPEARRG